MINYKKIIFRTIVISSIAIFGLKAKFSLREFFIRVSAKVNPNQNCISKSWEYINLYSCSKDELIDLCKQLTKENAQYQNQIHILSRAQEHLERLEKLVKIGEYNNYTKIYAKVISRHISAWNHRLLINKGKRDGLYENAIVCSINGVVGKVVEVYHACALIELVTSPKFRLAVRLKDDWTPILFHGDTKDFSNIRGALENIPINLENKIAVGMPVVCSNITSDSIDNLQIGKVKSISYATNGMFLNAEIDIDQLVKYLEEVVVLVKFNIH